MFMRARLYVVMFFSCPKIFGQQRGHVTFESVPAIPIRASDGIFTIAGWPDLAVRAPFWE
jgi:hypothetical protein